MRRVLRYIFRSLIGVVALVGGLQRKPPNARNRHSHGPWRQVAQLLREQRPWKMEQYDRSYR